MTEFWIERGGLNRLGLWPNNREITDNCPITLGRTPANAAATIHIVRRGRLKLISVSEPDGDLWERLKKMSGLGSLGVSAIVVHLAIKMRDASLQLSENSK